MSGTTIIKNYVSRCKVTSCIPLSQRFCDDSSEGQGFDDEEDVFEDGRRFKCRVKYIVMRFLARRRNLRVFFQLQIHFPSEEISERRVVSIQILHIDLFFKNFVLVGD